MTTATRTTLTDPLVELGYIAGVFGVRGEVRLHLHNPESSLFDGPLDVSRTLLAMSTYPMRGAQWLPMEPGELRVARRGSTVWRIHIGPSSRQHMTIWQAQIRCTAPFSGCLIPLNLRIF